MDLTDAKRRVVECEPMFARGLSVRDIEAAFTDDQGRLLLSKTAVSELSERLWQDYEAFASRDLSEFDLLYLFVDGIAERLHLGQPREAVLAAWGITLEGKKVLLHLAPGTKEDTASCREFYQDMRRRGLRDPLLAVTDGAPGLIRATEECLPRTGRQRCPGAQDAQPAEQGAGAAVAGVQGLRHRLLPGGFAGAGAPAAR